MSENDFKACEGKATIDVWQNMEECRACEMRVRHDLVDHPFFGFRNSCPLRSLQAPPPDPQP